MIPNQKESQVHLKDTRKSRSILYLHANMMGTILESYKKMFPNKNLINAKSSLEKNDHPELNYAMKNKLQNTCA